MSAIVMMRFSFLDMWSSGADALLGGRVEQAGLGHVDGKMGRRSGSDRRIGTEPRHGFDITDP